MSSQVARVQPKYESFLWRELMKIRDAETLGDYMTACSLTVSLIKFLPSQFKTEFGKRAESITTAVEIYSANLKTHALTGQVAKHRKVQAFSRDLFNTFINDLIKALDQAGYMEMHIRPRFTQRRKLDVKSIEG